MEIIREALVDGIRLGLPIVGAVTGAHYATKRSSKWTSVAKGAGVGYFAGWAAQKVVLGLLERLAFPRMPEVPAVTQGAMPQSPNEYQDPSDVYEEARAASSAPKAAAPESMSGMGYSPQGPAPAPPAAPATHNQKGGGDGVQFHQAPASTGQEAHQKVSGTLFADAYGGRMGI